MPALPRAVRQLVRAGSEIFERRGIRRGRLGTLAGKQVELGQLFPFLW